MIQQGKAKQSLGDSESDDDDDDEMMMKMLLLMLLMMTKRWVAKCVWRTNKSVK